MHEIRKRQVRELQTQVQKVIDELVEREVERGLQVAASFEGDLVIDTWSGVADPTTGRMVDGEPSELAAYLVANRLRNARGISN